MRLVTLTGPGGSGKTRLAQEIGAEALARFPDGVFFVDLGLIRAADYVVRAMASVLGVRENPGEPLPETVSRSLAERCMLLMLDNCEQVLAAAPDVAALLARCRQLTLLATSREPLHLRAERTFPVVPLPLPNVERLPNLPALAQVPSVALFVERAQAADPAFALTETNGPAVAAICRRLDGLPLAIELAAARVRLLPPEALLTRLERSLSLLTSGARDAPVRQRTLRDTIAWSYDLLPATDQVLSRRLSVLVGGWTLEAAEAVTSPDGVLEGFGDSGTWSSGAWSAGSTMEVGSLASGCSRRFRSSGWRGRPRAAKRRSLGTDTRRGPWRSRSRPILTCSARAKSRGWIASRPSTPTCGPRWTGSSGLGNLSRSCGWRGRSGSSGTSAAITARGGAGWSGRWRGAR